MAHFTDKRPQDKPLTGAEASALAWAVKNYSEIFPPENRNRIKNGDRQPIYDRLRVARSALRKMRELKKQGL